MKNIIFAERKPAARNVAERGTVLIVTMVILSLLATLLAALLMTVNSRQAVGDFSNTSASRFYAAEMGLTRAKNMVTMPTAEHSRCRRWQG